MDLPSLTPPSPRPVNGAQDVHKAAQRDDALTMVPDSSATLQGWGRLPAPGYEVRGENLERLTQDAVLCRGLGRSYGDSSLPPPGQRAVVGTALADRFLSFDEQTGVLRAEAGLSVDEMIRVLFRRGWFPPVTPGTKFVTLGGCVASDVHGKNHHTDGTFGEHVKSLRMRVADGRIVDCSPTQEAELFWATVGGMGLTGHILEVELQMQSIPSCWVWMESERVPNIDEYIARLNAAKDEWPMTMGWIDCLSRGSNMGRGILMKGRWATPEQAPPNAPKSKKRMTVPFVLPGWLLNGLTMRTFNFLYYWKHLAKKKAGVIHPEPFFWPLDFLHEWNRGYGPRGFTQYQCVIPHEAGPDAARRFLDLLTSKGGASFLCVIKDCGHEGQGLLSFPKPGISIALDIPVRDGTQELVDTLNEHLIEQGGRIYLTKDAFTRPEHFSAMEPRLAEFQRIRQQWDPELRFRSAQSVRMLGDPAEA